MTAATGTRLRNQLPGPNEAVKGHEQGYQEVR